MIRRPPRSTRTDTLCPYTTLFRSGVEHGGKLEQRVEHGDAKPPAAGALMNGDLPHEHGFRVVDKAIARYPAADLAIALGKHAGFGEMRALQKVAVERVGIQRRAGGSSEERRVGKEGVRTCRSRWSPFP